MTLNVQGTFVSQKINRIRWIPEEYVDTKYFFTGSWDDDRNSVKVWTLESPKPDEDVESPRVLSEYPLNGDVTQIKFTDKVNIAVSSSDGDVRLLELNNYDKNVPLKEVFLWKKLHNFGVEECSCTCLDTLDGDIASVGEEGSVRVLSSRRGEELRAITVADSASLHCICFIKNNEVVTGNVRGHMKIWDLREAGDRPAAAFLVAGDEQAATCVLAHPARPHLLLAGSEAGTLALWDLRLNSFPTSLVNAHSAAVTEMQFHPENPQKLLSSSVSGELWDWNVDFMTRDNKDNQIATMPLQDKNTMTVNSLMPSLQQAINTLHCDKGRILCGADNEAVYLIKNYNY